MYPLFTPEAAILLTSTKGPRGPKVQRSKCWTFGKVQHRKSPSHKLLVTLRMLRVKSDKYDWPRIRKYYAAIIHKVGPSQIRGRDSWCWPKGTWSVDENSMYPFRGERYLITGELQHQ